MRALLTAMILMTAGVARAEMVCLMLPPANEAVQADAELRRLHENLAPALERFPDLAEVVAERRPRLCLSDVMGDAHGYFEEAGNRIVISRALPEGMRSAVLLHELRHLWQAAEKTCPTDALGMKEYARATFAIEADASAIALLMAWEMKDEGAPQAWEALAAWPEQADIAQSFAETMADTGDRALATTAAFYQWYASEIRRERYYVASCSDYLDREDATHRLPRYQMIGAQFFEELCRLPDGRVYECSDPREEFRR